LHARIASAKRLQGRGFEHPELALKNFSAGRYDIVIADIKMPKISGFEFVRQVDCIDKSAKIILMTAFQLKKEEFEKVMPSARVDAFIKKPIGMTKLIDHIETLSRDRSAIDYSIASIGMSMAISLVSVSSEAASILL
jgi:two-component SAPR family response regulator